MVNVKKTTIAIVLTLLMAASILMVSNNATFIGTAKAYQPKAGEFGGSYFNITGVYSAPPSGVTPAWTWTPLAYISVSPGTIGV